MGIYTSIFKYIVPNRRWLMDKMKLGYKFTAMGSCLTTIMDYNVGSARAYGVLRNHSPNAWVFRTMHVTLIVTKHGRFVPCTDEFMPSHLLLLSNDNKNRAASANTSKTDYLSRYVESDCNGIKIKITFPLIDQSTSETLFIDDELYKMVPHVAYRKGTRWCNAIRYCYISETRCVISQPIKPVLSDQTMPGPYNGVLFQIITSLPSKSGGKRVLYVVKS
ncbi:hypothetical protein CBER1_11656 [Cercospora berteroae]|uniref:Uncharacterized protein n=1 Tax=Cercospora berteroae TaxID=357750 RepID=A0A2S6BZQ8_9PEZI|nr:hypothetical protein CBER1_11656 [Cercospora berteroae]